MEWADGGEVGEIRTLEYEVVDSAGRAFSIRWPGSRLAVVSSGKTTELVEVQTYLGAERTRG